jgi:hypothetical protein
MMGKTIWAIAIFLWLGLKVYQWFVPTDILQTIHWMNILNTAMIVAVKMILDEKEKNKK